MLEKKAIDAMEYSMPSENKALGFQEIAKYVIMPGIHAGAWTFEAAFQGEEWDKIPKDLQEKIPSRRQARDLREPELRSSCRTSPRSTRYWAARTRSSSSTKPSRKKAKEAVPQVGG